MAIATGKKSVEFSVKNYLGIGAMQVIAINPTKAELDKLFNRVDSQEPSYLSKTKMKGKDGSDVEVDTLRLTFYLKTDETKACNNGIKATIPVSYFIKNGYTWNKDGSKVQVIDPYGRTDWASEEDIKSGNPPVKTTKDGSRQFTTISKGFRPCYQGEEQLVKFLVAYLGIDDPMEWDTTTQSFKMRDAQGLKACECLLDNVKALFKGDVSEIKTAINNQPDNTFKLLFGIRTTNDNKTYQCAYTNMPMKLNVTKYTKLEKQLENDSENGRHPSEYYEVTGLREYTQTATDYSKKEEAADNNPFSNPFESASSSESQVESTQQDSDDLPFDNPFAAM